MLTTQCDFHSRTATAKSWNLSQNLDISGKEVTVYNIAATQAGMNMKIDFKFKNASGESKTFTVFNGGTAAIPSDNVAINIIPRFDGVLVRLMNGPSDDSTVGVTTLYICDTVQSGCGITESLIPAVGEYSLVATGLSGTATVIINE